MGWDRVWTLALVQFGAEDIEIRILIGLGMAFLTLMIVEGLRASFRLRPPRLPSVPQPPVMQRSFASSPAAGAKSAAKSPPQPLRARTVIARTTPRPVRPAASRHQPVKPGIRRSHTVARKPNLTEEALPYSPLSPNR
jgi:hypothetical protein